MISSGFYDTMDAGYMDNRSSSLPFILPEISGYCNRYPVKYRISGSFLDELTYIIEVPLLLFTMIKKFGHMIIGCILRAAGSYYLDYLDALTS